MEAEMITEDEKQIWTTKTSVDIFDKYYYGTAQAGTEDEVTVENAQSVDRMNLIAPGTESSYEFWVKNTGPGESSLMAMISTSNTGDSTMIPHREAIISSIRFTNF